VVFIVVVRGLMRGTELERLTLKGLTTGVAVARLAATKAKARKAEGSVLWCIL